MRQPATSMEARGMKRQLEELGERLERRTTFLTLWLGAMFLFGFLLPAFAMAVQQAH